MCFDSDFASPAFLPVVALVIFLVHVVLGCAHFAYLVVIGYRIFFFFKNKHINRIEISQMLNAKQTNKNDIIFLVVEINFTFGVKLDFVVMGIVCAMVNDWPANVSTLTNALMVANVSADYHYY